MKNTRNNVAQNTEKSKPESDRYAAFDKLKRDFEKAYASGGNYSSELMELSTAMVKTSIVCNSG